MQGQAVSGMDELLLLLMKTPVDTTFLLNVVRWERLTRVFRALTFTVRSKPIGAEFLPI